MADTHWIVEGSIDPRWPINTRGNIGEVFPEVLTPFSYHLAVKAAEKGWRDAYATMGILDRRDFSTDEPVIIGLYSGYGYLNLSYLRMLGVRAPGSSPEAIDTAFFGEGNPPPYQAMPGDKRPLATLKILRTVLAALSQKDMPSPVADSRARVAAWERRQPNLTTATDRELLDYLYAYGEVFKPVFGNHMITTGTAAIVSGVLSDAATAAGKPGLVTKLLGAADDVVSAQYSQELWKVAKLVRDRPSLMAVFDAGVAGIGERLAAHPEATAVNEAFARFIEVHGHRGPNDWELSARTWENTPELAWAAVDRMRLSTGDLAPAPRVASSDRERTDAAAEILPTIRNPLDKLNFKKALVAAPWWARAREATRDLAIRAHNPTRRVFFELARRAAERGGTRELRDVAMLDPNTELPHYVAEPAGLLPVIAERVALRDRFAAVEPPFFITGQSDVVGIEELERRQGTAATAAAAGTVLRGAAGCAGVARGRARIVLDPADPAGLEPGDVLVAPLTDPAWTPLFLPAAAVVVNVGALMSHAVIVSRELGIPCVVAVENATHRIPDGAMVEVDGVAGTVTILP